MSSLGDASQQRLWPEPDQLHSFIDRWQSYIAELENRLQTEIDAHKVTETTSRAEIVQLKARLENVIAPYVEQVQNLEARITVQNARIAYLEGDIREATVRLAHMMETSPDAKGITLQGLVGHAILFTDEAKKQFRDSL